MLVLGLALTQPRGPADWPLESWVGSLLYAGLFVLALWGIARLGAGAPDGDDS